MHGAELPSLPALCRIDLLGPHPPPTAGGRRRAPPSASLGTGATTAAIPPSVLCLALPLARGLPSRLSSSPQPCVSSPHSPMGYGSGGGDGGGGYGNRRRLRGCTFVSPPATGGCGSWRTPSTAQPGTSSPSPPPCGGMTVMNRPIEAAWPLPPCGRIRSPRPPRHLADAGQLYEPKRLLAPHLRAATSRNGAAFDMGERRLTLPSSG